MTSLDVDRTHGTFHANFNAKQPKSRRGTFAPVT